MSQRARGVSVGRLSLSAASYSWEAQAKVVLPTPPERDSRYHHFVAKPSGPSFLVRKGTPPTRDRVGAGATVLFAESIRSGARW